MLGTYTFVDGISGGLGRLADSVGADVVNGGEEGTHLHMIAWEVVQSANTIRTPLEVPNV